MSVPSIVIILAITIFGHLMSGVRGAEWALFTGLMMWLFIEAIPNLKSFFRIG